MPTSRVTGEENFGSIAAVLVDVVEGPANGGSNIVGMIRVLSIACVEFEILQPRGESNKKQA